LWRSLKAHDGRSAIAARRAASLEALASRLRAEAAARKEEREQVKRCEANAQRETRIRFRSVHGAYGMIERMPLCTHAP
jgi:hypothetical protein